MQPIEINSFTMNDGIILLDSNNVVVQSTNYPELVGVDAFFRDYIMAAKQTLKPVISGGLMGKNGKFGIGVAVPVTSAGAAAGKYLGMLVAALPTPEFFARYGNTYDIDSSLIVALDRDGTYLTAGLSDYLGKNFFSEEIQQKVDRNSDLYRVYSDSVRGGRLSSAFFQFGGVAERFVVAAPVVVGGEQAMTVAISMPLAAIYSQVDDILFAQRVQTMTMLGGIAAAVAAIVILLARWGSSMNKEVARKTELLQEANEVLAAANEKLLLHDKLQREFVNVAAHELRTPIQPLLDIASLLQSELGCGDKTEISRPRLEMIVRNAKRLQQLSSDILEVSRIEGHTLRLDKQVVDLKATMLQAVEDCRPFIAAGQPVKMVFESSGREGEGEEEARRPILVEADQSKLFEVASNLIRNAAKFTDEGTISVSVGEKEGDGSAAVVAVRDTGRGIPEILPRLFTKFASKSEQGTGLGLYISKSIIEAHGGRMWAENNRDGKGATFWFSLPLAKKVPEENPGKVVMQH